MKNLKFVAFVVATLISSLFAQAQTTTVDSTTTVGKNKKTEVVSAKTTVKTTKAEIKDLRKLIKDKQDLIELTQKQMPNVGDKNQRKALGDSVKVWNKQISTWNKEIKALEKRKKGEDVDIAKAKKGFDRVMVQADTTVKPTTTNPSIAKDTTTTAAEPLKKGAGTNSKPSTPTKGAGTTAKPATITAANTASNDTTPIRPQAETDFIKRNYGKHAYGTAIDIVVLSDDKVDVKTFLNVKSRSGKSETQWGVTVKHADGSVTEYLVSGENPADALNDKLSLANTEGNGGTAKLSVKHGDDTDGKLSPSDLE